ncbi:MAG: RNA 2',3'-cyclic phosphodiesterase [Bacillota bacterium]|nr:RNA 2',3'-cyclic phosphodiesterase [Bacillota bacterium]
MRLFIAINFDEDIKAQIAEVREELRNSSSSGNFTRDENLHLTLVFLGEVSGSRVREIENIMEETEEEPFELEFGKLGCFKRDSGGDLWWLGCGRNNGLMSLQRQLSERLRASGFKIEKRQYKPHLTLGREVVIEGGGKVFGSRSLEQNPIKVPVGQISLMHSERINGKLTYTSLYEKPLWYK